MSHSANAAESFFRKTRSRPRNSEAWQTWILICATAAGVTFCFNLALTIWASTFGVKNGTAKIKVGKCSDIKTWDLWFHLGINVLSSLLLAASNYTMQCLSGPVREEIDKGHRNRIAFDIGIPSLKNLRRISRIKLILWGLLAVSSIPLHLVYNSVVFSTLTTHNYAGLVVTSDFLSGAPFGYTTQQSCITPYLSAKIENIRQNVSSSIQDQINLEWQKLNSTHCREAYRPPILPDRSDVLVVLFVNSTGNSVLEYRDYYISDGSASWTCFESKCSSDTCDRTCGNSNADYFELYDSPVDHCYSRKTAETCQLRFSLPIMIIVMICNLTKTVCMLLTIHHRFATPLLTLGDAVASFLERPDIYTRNNCLSDKYNFQQRSKVERGVDQLDLQPLHPPLRKPSLWRFFQPLGAKNSYISIDLSLNGEELQDLGAGSIPSKNNKISKHQDWRKRTRGFLTSATFNGQTVQSLVTGEPTLKNRITSQHDNNARECIRGFLTSVTFNGQLVQGLVTRKQPLTRGFTSQHDNNNASEHEGWSQNIKECLPKRHLWFSAASPSRWLFSLSLSSTAIIATGVLLGIFYNTGSLKDKSMQNLWKIGYGATVPELLLNYTQYSGFAPMILLANLPQTIVSFLYLTYNALFTCMLVAKEWSQFAHKRKALRVSDPVKGQRSTYWLQLPFTYSIPLLIMSSLLHWLVSQTLFFVRIEVVGSPELITSCGYSPIAIITVIPIGIILVLVVVLMGFRRYEKGIPFTGSSSAVISAACHPPEEDLDARFLPVMWGDVKTEDSPLGHCCLTSFAVSTPLEGNMYACVDDIWMQKGFKNE